MRVATVAVLLRRRWHRCGCTTGWARRSRCARGVMRWATPATRSIATCNPEHPSLQHPEHPRPQPYACVPGVLGSALGDAHAVRHRAGGARDVSRRRRRRQGARAHRPRQRRGVWPLARGRGRGRAAARYVAARHIPAATLCTLRAPACNPMRPVCSPEHPCLQSHTPSLQPHTPSLQPHAPMCASLQPHVCAASGALRAVARRRDRDPKGTAGVRPLDAASRACGALGASPSPSPSPSP